MESYKMYLQEPELKRFRGLTTIATCVVGALSTAIVAASFMMLGGYFSLSEFGSLIILAFLASIPIGLIIGHNFQRTNGRIQTLAVWVGVSAIGVFLGMQLWLMPHYIGAPVLPESDAMSRVVDMVFMGMISVFVSMFIIAPAIVSTLLLGRRWNLYTNTTTDFSVMRCVLSVLVIGLYFPIVMGVLGDMIETL